MDIHVAMTEDERVWVEFNGVIPRVGEEVEFITDEIYVVTKVRYFICKLCGDDNGFTSQARVIIEEIK